MSIATILSFKQLAGLGPAPGHGDHGEHDDHHPQPHLAIHTHSYEPLVEHSGNTTYNARAGAAIGIHNNVNVLLAGIMLSGIISLLAIFCYCCHRNLRKQATRSEAYWREREPEGPLEVFTLDGRGYELSGVFTTTDECSFETVPAVHSSPGPPAPPPPYDAVVRPANQPHIKANPKTKDDENTTVETLAAAVRHQPYKMDDSPTTNPNCQSGLPSYEAALRLEALGYV